MWTVSSTTLNVSESEAVGFVIGTIAATDVDAVDTSLQYEITSGLITNEFAVVGEGMSCNLTVGETGLDFEKKRLYTLSISATDNGGLVASSTVVVNVEDENDVSISNINIYAASGSADGLSTAGGDVISITGTNFGTTDGTTTTVTATYYRNGGSVAPFATTNCAVVVSNTVINCTTLADGYGTDLRVHLVVSGTASGNAVSSSDLTVRFEPPVINAIATAQPLPTSGSSTRNVILTGENFGPLNIAWEGEYGITASAGYCAVDCLVTVAHTEISCKSVAGVGSGHTWRVLLVQDGTGNTLYESLSSLASTDYASSIVTTTGSTTNRISTKGGDRLTLVGTNFGPMNHQLAHCDGSAVTTGNDATPAPLPIGVQVNYGTESVPKKYMAMACQVTVAHTEIECSKTPPGVGHQLNVRVDIGFEGHVVLGTVSAGPSRTVNYTIPTVTAVSGSGALASSTTGDGLLEITGSGFGPVDHAESVRALYSQEDADSLPMFFAKSCRVLSDESMTCKTGVGVGYNFSYSVEIEGQMSLVKHAALTGAKALGRTPSHEGGAYGRPTVSTVTTLDGALIYSANTKGKELVLISGTNFGPIASWNPVSATFGLPLKSPGSQDQQFDAIGCNVTRAHTEITCQTSPGAGSKHQWNIQVAGMTSVLAETSYGAPTITGIAAKETPGGTSIAVNALSSRGGQEIVLTGTNFGPPSKSATYLKSVTYGATGTEYVCSNPIVVTHNNITCVTDSGSGNNLIFIVNILSQDGASTVTASYAPPTATDVYTSDHNTTGSAADTIELEDSFRMIIKATNAGVGLSNGNVLNVLWDDAQIDLIPDKSKTVQKGVFDLIAFRLPELIGRDGLRSANVPLRIRVTETNGNSQTSDPILWNYRPPVIDQIHVTSGPSPTQQRLTLVGSNFGKPGANGFPVGSVLLTAGDGGGECNGFPCELTVSTLNSMYIEEWKHRAIKIVYRGTFGSMKIKTSRVAGGTLVSNTKAFNNTSPTILSLSSDRENSMLLFSTLGFVANSGGTVTLLCRYCDNQFLTVKIGEVRQDDKAGRNPQATLNCPITGAIEFPVTVAPFGGQLSRITCQVPPGIGQNVSVVVVRAGARSLKATQLQYIAPSIQSVSADSSPTNGATVTINGANFGDPGSASCYMDEVQLTTVTGTGTQRNELQCQVPPGIGGHQRDLWVQVAGQRSCRHSQSSHSCLGTAPTMKYLPPQVTNVVLPPEEDRSTEGGFEITLEGNNFATSGVGSNVTIAGTNCIVTATSFNEIRCLVQESVGEDLGIEVQVADQISGGSNSQGGIRSLPTIAYTKPEIYTVTPAVLPTNASRSDGSRYNITLTGRNFGTDVLTGSFKIYVGETNSNNVAVIEKGVDVLIHDHRKIVFVAPQGQGKDIQIVLEVGPNELQAQNSTDLKYISYLPPTITRTTPEKGPTDGCKDRLGWEPLVVWAQRTEGVSPKEVSEDANVYRRKCTNPFMVDIFGSNFGTKIEKLKATVISSDGSIVFSIYPPDDQNSHLCPDLVFTDQKISLCSPVGYGVNLQLSITIAGQKTTNEYLYSFEPPVVTAVVRTDDRSSPYDGSKKDNLVIHGTNFGGVDTKDVKVLIDSIPCDGARWNLQHPSDGFPYITCLSRLDTVGNKNISFFNAGQFAMPVPVLENDFTSVVRSACLPGEITLDGKQENTWGRRGELCGE